MAMTATSGGSAMPEIGRFGLSQVYAPTGGGKVDVVFVHGLNGDPQKTWTSEKSKTFWPSQLLPPILEEEKARILVYGYDADVTSFTDGVSKDKIHNHAEHLIAELAANRRIIKATERPIIFVAHSLGGLVVKRALIYSSEIRGNHTEHLRSVFVSTFGILFLGTPHYGSDVAQWGTRLGWICDIAMPKKIVDHQSQLVEALKKNNETLQNIDRQFIQLTSRFRIYFFHEGKPTNLGGTMQYIVDEESASPNIQDVERASIQQDHSHMCKFENQSSPGFFMVAEGIQRYAGEAPDLIVKRWASEKKSLLDKKKAEIDELIPGSTLTPNTESTGTTPDTSQLLSPKNSPRPSEKDESTNTSEKPADPYFIVPPGFSTNTHFVGMHKEYKELDRRLFDKRRRDGTATVLLHGQPGGGKTHLARQYVNKNRKKFSGGIFWIMAKSKEERYHTFWNIKQKVVARDCPDLCNGVNGNDFVQIVKSWFENRHEWLMVFDGVTVEQDEDATDLAKFVPYSKNSSIIYISRAKNLESKHRLLSPIAIRVGPLKDEEGKRLLFKELRIEKPTDAEKAKATELVKNTGGLPLAISAISHRLADTHEPLAKFKLSYSTNPTLENTYNQILDDLLRLGYAEAWNLMMILCWFGQNIPVEMIHLGLKILQALKIEVKTSERGGKPDINDTFGVLMRYALIERNEPHDSDKDSMSSSRDSLVDPEPIDMLKIHSVVQNFCCDSLTSSGLIHTWLGYAVKLFSYSYQQADRKIKQKDERGRVSDYRYYLVHGQALWDHSVTYQSKSQPLDDIREGLHRTLDLINQEIRNREPGSSQESLNNGIFQVSIFDRTSSSSDSGPSIPGPPTPDHRPTPPPLDSESLFGFPLDKATDSPNSFGTASPGVRPKILGYSPSSRPLEYEDAGYESDRETTSHPMQQNLSEQTARPSSRSRAPTTESQNEGWEVVKPTRKPRKPRGRRDLGSFRPTPAKAQLDRKSAIGSLDRPPVANSQPQKRSPSSAAASLQKLSPSPPPSRTGVADFFRRVTQPTWAGIAAGKTAPATIGSVNGNPTQPLGAPLPFDRGRSNEKSGRPGTAPLSSSPLASEFIPSGLPREENKISGNGQIVPAQFPAYPVDYNSAYAPVGLHYSTPYPGSNSSLSQYSQQRPISGIQNPYSAPPQPLGPNPAPLPINEDITITSTRPPFALYTANDLPQQQQPPPQQIYPTPPSQIHSNRTSPHYIQSPSPSHSPYIPSPVQIPAGYYSQPMSRDHSGQSRLSTAETEPMQHPPTFSPSLRPVQPASDPLHYVPIFHPQPQRQYQQQQYQQQQQQAYPFDPNAPPIPTPGPYPHHPTQNQNQNQGPNPDLSPSPLSASISMSRSSSGPGMTIPLPDPSGSGKIGIVRFDNAGQVQFGEHSPISLEEAGRRTREYEELLRLRGQEEGRGKENGGKGRERVRARDGGKAMPYPDVNLIPTGSDAGALGGMVGEEDGGEVGLGVRMG